MTAGSGIGNRERRHPYPPPAPDPYTATGDDTGTNTATTYLPAPELPRQETTPPDDELAEVTEFEFKSKSLRRQRPGTQPRQSNPPTPPISLLPRINQTRGSRRGGWYAHQRGFMGSPNNGPGNYLLVSLFQPSSDPSTDDSYRWCLLISAFSFSAFFHFTAPPLHHFTTARSQYTFLYICSIVVSGSTHPPYPFDSESPCTHPPTLRGREGGRGRKGRNGSMRAAHIAKEGCHRATAVFIIYYL